MESTEIKICVPIVKHFAVWYGPAWDDIYDCPVQSRDPNQFVMDEAADHFRFYDRLELEWEVDGKVILLRSEPFNHSVYYVPGGRLLTDEESNEAFRTSLRHIRGDRSGYVLFQTRHRKVVDLYQAEIEFSPAQTTTGRA